MRSVLSAMVLQALFGPINAQTSTAPLPTVTPSIFDPAAPNPQECPGYKAVHVAESAHGFKADLSLAGPPCNAFGTDVKDLILEVSYQAKERLNVNIRPKYIASFNTSWFILDSEFVEQPQWNGYTTRETSDLQLKWDNNPSFQFSISRCRTGEELFSTFGYVIVFEDQFIEVVTRMVDQYNIYGLAENIHNFRLGNNFTQTLWNDDTVNALDGNSYGSHPFYQETRYSHGGSAAHGVSTAHGVYARNAHGQEWIMEESSLTYRAIGGSIDLYFLSGESGANARPTWSSGRHGPHRSNSTQSDTGSSALEVFRQYQTGCTGLPAMQMYWAFGFLQCHWGWKDIAAVRETVENYSKFDIPLEGIGTDIDVYDRSRMFTNDPVNFASSDMQEFHTWLRSRGQRYMPLVDSVTYFPNNASDSYPPFERGDALQTFIRDPTTGYYYIGSGWPGSTVWADWLAPSSEEWYTNELRLSYERTPYDAVWVDLNEVLSMCDYSCGNSGIPANFTVPSGPPLNVTRDTRQLNSPPYRLNIAKASKQLIDDVIATNATHNDRYNTTEYDIHNLWSTGIARATYNALSGTVIPRKRPFIIMRSSFPGSGKWAGNWGGDNKSLWGSMFLSISQALTFQMSGIPMFGTDTCGFGDSATANATEELCARWMELNAFFPFYRNHYAIDKTPQEAYIWPTVANASRKVIAIRYSLLTYMYTLFYYAHTQGDTVIRALAWEFPDDSSLGATDTQFLWGPSILVTPVLTQGASTVDGVFPGIGQGGTRWFDWYTLQEVKNIRPQQNVTMNAPLEHINLHIRGGSILPIQAPGNTTSVTRTNPYGLIITLDERGSASGSLYLDDGESIVQSSTKLVTFDFSQSRLTTRIQGNYHAAAPIANITIAGLRSRPHQVLFKMDQRPPSRVIGEFKNETLYVTGLGEHTSKGAWENEFSLQLF